MTRPAVLVAAVGQALDPLDRVGLLVAARLEGSVEDDVEVVTLSDPAGLLEAAVDRTAVVVVDAARTGGASAAPVVLSLGELPQVSPGRSLGTHGLTLTDVLAYATALRRLPRHTYVVAVPVDSTGGDGRPQPPAVDEAARLVLDLLGTLPTVAAG